MPASAQTPNFEVKLWPKQGEMFRVLNMTSTEVLGYGGARGGGKSAGARYWAIHRRVKYENSRGLIIRKSFPELERTHILKIQQELPKGSYTYTDRRHTFVFGNGSELECGYIENDNDVLRYQGAEYDDIIIDEAQLHSKYVFQCLRACLRTTNPIVKPRMLLTFNWGGIGHSHLKRMFWRSWMKTLKPDKDKPSFPFGIEKGFRSRNKDYQADTWENPSHWDKGERPEDFAFVHAKVWDNPSITRNDPEYVNRLKALPESLRMAYLDGDPDVFEGQFFSEFGQHLKIDPFRIEQHELDGRVFGDLDSGTTHPTVAHVWYVPRLTPNVIAAGGRPTLYLLKTYHATGGTIRGHALELFDQIESDPMLKGVFPSVIWADPAMWTVVPMNEQMVRAPIDEYIEVFAKRNDCRFEKANNDKRNGCQIMRQLFKGEDGRPGMRYFAGANASFEEGISAVMFDKNDKEKYAKMDGDDEADASRYGMVGIYSFFATEQMQNKTVTLSMRINKAREGVDWYHL